MKKKNENEGEKMEMEKKKKKTSSNLEKTGKELKWTTKASGKVAKTPAANQKPNGLGFQEKIQKN